MKLLCIHTLTSVTVNDNWWRSHGESGTQQSDGAENEKSKTMSR